jgi:glyoxylase-like metal-dependent hydrolase (beta-lactamase superfamily II)
MELCKDLHFLKVEKTGVVDSSSILAIRDARGLVCVEMGGGGESNIRQTLRLFQDESLDVSGLHTVVISHTHADHMGAIAHFRERVPGIVVVDHETDVPFLEDNTLLDRIFDADLVNRYFPGNRFSILDFYRTFCPISQTTPDRTVVEGDRLTFGEFMFDVIHTPGHHPGHISLFEPGLGLLFVGDMVGMEVPFYSPSSGGVDAYLTSMEKYLALDMKQIVPSHGDLIENPREAVEGAVKKVKRREEKLLEALREKPRSFHELLPVLFRSPHQYMFPGAVILASHIEKLRRQRMVEEREDSLLALL